MSYIKGSVKQFIYESDKGFIVGLFKVNDSDNLDAYLNKSIIFTGTFHQLKLNMDYIFNGDLIEHPKFGEQYLVTSYEQIMPESTNGIISFLSSKLFPGVGVKLATDIVNALGDNVLDLIISNYQNLLIVPKMTEKKALKIQQILNKENESYKIIINLQNMGFTMSEASKIYKVYKEAALKILDDNIYNVISDVEGISFLTVDKVAALKEISENDERRIEACILYIINDLCLTNGDTYADIHDIYNGVINYLNFDFLIDDFNYRILKLNKDGLIIIEDDRYYLKKYYDSEVKNAKFINTLLSNPKDLNESLDHQIQTLEKEYRLKYNEKQKNAIKSSFNENFLIITGGPGTGKTTIIRAIVEIYIRFSKLRSEKAHLEMALLAPTGRAAKRIMETTGVTAMTIHKFLKWNKETNEFGVNENNKADVKFVIVDEVSMIDNFLLTNLFTGLPSNIKLIFVGDHNQLPSVGPGDVLKDLINSKKIKTIELNDLYRQKEGSYIISLAHEIKDGIIDNDFTKKRDDYNFIEASKGDIKTYILKLCENAIQKGYSYKDIQVLVPMYKGINGIDSMNGMLQDVFNPKADRKNTFISNNVEYRVGDKVLQIKNNNDLNVSNGDIGVIRSINLKDSEYTIEIDFSYDIIEFSKKDFEDIRLGYAISIHKAQGSEFDIVVMPMDSAYSRMLYRKLIYTGITRAKKTLMIVGEKDAFIKAIMNNKERIRKTSLSRRLE